MDEDFPLELLGGDLEVAERFDGDGDLCVRVNRSRPRMWLDRSDVERLRDHLTALLGDGAQPSGDRPVELVVGREYRLLPGAHCSGGDSAGEPCFRGVTRVRLERQPDGDGDVQVTIVDGPESYKESRGWWVLSRFLAPLDPLAQPLAEVLTGKASAADVAQAARTVAGMADQAHFPRSARLWRAFADELAKGGA